MYLNYFIVFCGLAGGAQAILEALHEQLEYNCNGADKFVCKNSRCIPMSKRCDGKNDCFDNSDERDCDQYQCSPPLYFKCKTKKCIPASFHCDGDNDCGDFSDEVGCAEFKLLMSQPTNCTSDEWTCHDKLCIPKDWVCNGVPDCLDQSDETAGCREQHNCTDFRCDDGHCIPHDWVCDGNYDCSGHEDEKGCEAKIEPSDCTLDERRYLCPDNKTCLRINQLCDGVVNCPDGVDESPRCLVNNCTKHMCSHECVSLPDGPRCLCPKGYHRINDRQCEDIDECQTYGICDQKCINLPGSYRCYCDPKYRLQDDKKTCKIKGGEAMLLYSSKTEIRGYFLESQHLFEVAKNLKQVVGVGFDGRHVYWTQIASSHESIARSLEDGDHRELLITSGLGAPEDLALDWVTGNIYFTDSEMQHIGVCSRDGQRCTVIVNEDIHKPRGIVLNPSEGEMFWSDWGTKPEIAKSLMDGSRDTTFVSTNIGWPNGLAIDHPNERLYWTDAKLMSLESIKLDGTDRRVVLQGVVKHPYSIAIFEDKLFWSDWTTRSVNFCDKFTGKNFQTLIKERINHIYGINIYHAAMKTNRTNSCQAAFCSDLCLLSGNGYACACPQDKVLASDKHVCTSVEKKQLLIAATKSNLVEIEQKILGKHNTKPIPTVATEITSLAYASDINTLFIGDKSSNSIISLQLESKESKTFIQFDAPSVISSMDYDYLGKNLFYCDSTGRTLNVMNVNTKEMRPLMHDFGGDNPRSVALVPEEGIMFVAFIKPSSERWHIDRFRVDGTSRTHVAEENLIGPISLHYDRDLHRILWSDSSRGAIESVGTDGQHRHTLLSVPSFPSGLTSLSRNIFWTNSGVSELIWIDKLKLEYPRRVVLDLPENDFMAISLVSTTSRVIPKHACQFENGNCSHICLAVHKEGVRCVCPIGLNLHSDGKTCIRPVQCSSEEFYCKGDDKCIPLSMYCDGKNDCKSGEDESNCKRLHDCPINYFRCGDGTCIKSKQVCDKHYDCKDKSDEGDICWSKGKLNACKPREFTCGNGVCLDGGFVCDGKKNCEGGEDEENCENSSCPGDDFRCNVGTCIPKRWECDREFDCPDMSDEHSQCAYASECDTKTNFKCRNGKCIPSKLRCDNSDDCGDYSDEIACHHPADKPVECSSETYSCISNSSICIPLKSICDGKPDCPHKEDEVQCGDCHLDEFECRNRRCIDRAWVCDGHDDCGDRSDEDNDLCGRNGTSPVLGRIWAPCDGFRCKNGNCIPMGQVCDKRDDCTDESDEGGLCEKACQSDSNPCEQRCEKTPAGATCGCEEGFRLAADGQSCKDVEECKSDPPVCSQLCSESIGSFTCGCYEGFALRADKRSCKSDGSPPQIFFTVGNQIRQLSVSENKLNIPFEENNAGITSLDFSIANDRLYFSVDSSPYIYRMDVITGDYSSGAMEAPGNPRYLTVDWTSENIYFVHGHSNYQKISVCSFKTNGCADVVDIDGGNTVQVEAMVIDPMEHILFYVVTKWSMFDHVRSIIYKSTLDGSRVAPIINIENQQISTLALNLNSKSLYFADRFSGNIIETDYDGFPRKTVFKNRTHPYIMQLYEDTLYFIEGQGHMVGCKLYGGRECKSIKTIAYTSAHFVIYQESRQPKGSVNWCDSHNCSYLCVPADAGPVCLCPDGSVEKEKCDSKTYNTISASRYQSPSPQFGSQQQMSKLSVSLIIILTLLTICGLIYGGYRFQKRVKSGSFSIPTWGPVEYTNPIYGKNNDLGSATRGMSSAEGHGTGTSVDFGNKDMEAAAKAILERVNPLVDI